MSTHAGGRRKASAGAGRAPTNAYLGEMINYGGEMMPRGRAIADMQARGFNELQVSRWLQGQEHSARVQAEREVAASHSVAERPDTQTPEQPKAAADKADTTRYADARRRYGSMSAFQALARGDSLAVRLGSGVLNIITPHTVPDKSGRFDVETRYITSQRGPKATRPPTDVHHNEHIATVMSLLRSEEHPHAAAQVVQVLPPDWHMPGASSKATKAYEAAADQARSAYSAWQRDALALTGIHARTADKRASDAARATAERELGPARQEEVRARDRFFAALDAVKALEPPILGARSSGAARTGANARSLAAARARAPIRAVNTEDHLTRGALENRRPRGEAGAYNKVTELPKSAAARKALGMYEERRLTDNRYQQVTHQDLFAARQAAHEATTEKARASALKRVSALEREQTRLGKRMDVLSQQIDRAEHPPAPSGTTRRRSTAGRSSTYPRAAVTATRMPQTPGQRAIHRLEVNITKLNASRSEGVG